MQTSSMKPEGWGDRRRFLKVGGICLALPMLESLGRGAVTRQADPPRRLVCLCTNFGLYGPAFFPAAAGRDFTASDYLRALDDLRKDYTVFSGISHPEVGGDHASETCFLTSAKHPGSSGFRNSVSLDLVAAKHVGAATRFPLITLSTQDSGTLTYSANGAAVPAWHRPSEIFAKLFLSGNPAQIKTETERLHRGQSVLDQLGDRLAALRKRVSARDQRQLADYTEAVREMERALKADEAWISRPKPTVSEAPPNDSTDRADTIGRAKIHLHLIKLALQTDSTRVASLFIRGMDLKPPIAGISEDHHNLTHHGKNPQKIEQLKIFERAEMAMFADFLKSLRDVDEADGNLLNHTQVLIGSNLGDASSHGTSNLPILLAGGGYRHGQHIAGDTGKNTPLARLYVSMLQRFGVETDQFGSGQGTLAGLE